VQPPDKKAGAVRAGAGKVMLALAVLLDSLGRTAIAVIIKSSKDLFVYLTLTLKLIWDKTVKIRTKIVNISKNLFLFVASPFVKLSLSFGNMRRDMKRESEEKGFIGAASAFFPYFGKFVFGKRGLAVTLFNYAAPILSFVFLFNVVSYATSANFALKLVVNDEFLGYIQNEQVFLDAEALVLQRVNYFGSDSIIEVHPEFSIAKSGESENLTTPQVANMILEKSNFKLEYAYGFFIDGVCYGAVREKDKYLIDETIASLLNKYSSNDPGVVEEVSFLNNVVYDSYELFLEESVVEPREIITMITATNNGEPYLPVIVTRVEEYDEKINYETEFRPDDTLFVDSTKVEQRGMEGISRRVAKVSYLNGEEIRRNIIESQDISEPVTEIIRTGIKPHTTGTVSTQQANHGMFIWPVVTADGSPVGAVTAGQYFRAGHSAVDIAGHGIFGTPIVAGGSGTVVFAGRGGNYGNHVIIQHENGMRTLYSHNNVNLVTEGQYVTQGEQIATLGETGQAYGAHLHFEVMAAGSHRRVNPMDYLPR
jgi:murein DD-endopeptidase MepM/ murein hydrolase activator NlpD